MQLTTDRLRESAATELSWLADLGFKYLRTKAQFRRKDAGGLTYITVDAVTHNRTDYHLAFFLGVRVDALESVVLSLVNESRALNHNDRSIHSYTVNTGPTSGNWKQPHVGTWTFRDIYEFTSSCPLIRTFVTEVALPLLDRNLTPEGVRLTLLEHPRQTQNFHPWRQIFAADCLFGDGHRLAADYSHLDARYARYVPHLRTDFESCYHAAKARI